MEVTVDAQPCLREQFIRGEASLHPDLGCRIQVVSEIELTQWHRQAPQSREFGNNVLANFHGQVVAFGECPVTGHALIFLVDMTGQPTGIRLMLPARTCLVANDALGQLRATLELEAFRYLQRQGHHHLTYREYLRARELGIHLPEADEGFRTGLLPGQMGPEPVEVVMPKGHSLSQCYRLADSADGDESDEANVHLLAALGRFPRPFVPVRIDRLCDGYSWTKLPTVHRVEVKAGKVLQESWVGGGMLICVESLSVSAHCSDGQVFESPVCMAMKPWSGEGQKPYYGDDKVYVTPAAQHQLSQSQMWYHLGGFSDDGDTFETQEHDFSQELDAFWMRLAGPNEPRRAKLVECLSDLKEGWESATVYQDGRVVLRQADGREDVFLPPSHAAREEVSS